VVDEASEQVNGGLEVDGRIAALERRLKVMDARLEIFDLEGRYSRTWDLGNAADWANLFTDDGVFEVVGVGGEDTHRVVGRAALEQMCRDFTARITGLHLLHLPEMTLNGESASSRIHFEFRSIRRDAADLTQQANVSGYYDTTYQWTSAGWRIAYRREKAVNRQRAVFYDL
jgi:hypothetical protein